MIAQYQFTEIQAKAILEMQLQRLTGLERQKIEDELVELRARIISLGLTKPVPSTMTSNRGVDPGGGTRRRISASYSRAAW